MIRSSAHREILSMNELPHCIVSRTKSRSATVFIELYSRPSKPSSLAMATRSILKGFPARAPQPRGLRFTRAMTSRRRSSSEAEAVRPADWLSFLEVSVAGHLRLCEHCASQLPEEKGMLTKTSISLSDLPIAHLMKSSKYPSNTLSSSRNQSLISVAICSFLLLPVCNLPPISLLSKLAQPLFIHGMDVSSFSFLTNIPVRHSSAICAKPFSMALNSACARIPAASKGNGASDILRPKDLVVRK